MKSIFCTLLLLTCGDLAAQNGFVRLSPDSVIAGYLRHYVSVQGSERGLEVWRTKKDKDPIRIPITSIHEYAIKKDTFKVLHSYQPLQDESAYYEVLELKRKKSGKVNLYSIPVIASPGYFDNTGYHPPTFEQDFFSRVLFILEHRRTGYLTALPADPKRLEEVMIKFFPDRFIVKYAEVNGKIKYKEIPDMVELYNSR